MSTSSKEANEKPETGGRPVAVLLLYLPLAAAAAAWNCLYLSVQRGRAIATTWQIVAEKKSCIVLVLEPLQSPPKR